MTLLLDTHACLWFLSADLKLSSAAKSAIEDQANAVLVSVASLWEIAKAGLGKLALAAPYAEIFPRIVLDHDMRILAIEPPHLNRLVEIPLLHRDPFDRLLIAQAQVESAVLVSADHAFDAYGVARIW